MHAHDTLLSRQTHSKRIQIMIKIYFRCGGLSRGVRQWKDDRKRTFELTNQSRSFALVLAAAFLLSLASSLPFPSLLAGPMTLTEAAPVWSATPSRCSPTPPGLTVATRWLWTTRRRNCALSPHRICCCNALGIITNHSIFAKHLVDLCSRKKTSRKVLLTSGTSRRVA